MVHSMNSKKILMTFSELQSELLKNGPTARFRAVRRNMTIIIRMYRLQLGYEKLKEKSPDLHVDFFEPFVPISAKDRANLDKAVAINRQIGKTLADFKRERASANTDAGG